MSSRASGSALHSHPLSSYGIDVRVGFSITDPGKSFLAALQSLAAGLWMGLLYLMKGVLLLLEWAFSLDLTSQAMPEARESLARLGYLGLDLDLPGAVSRFQRDSELATDGVIGSRTIMTLYSLGNYRRPRLRAARGATS